MGPIKVQVIQFMFAHFHITSKHVKEHTEDIALNPGKRPFPRHPMNIYERLTQEKKRDSARVAVVFLNGSFVFLPERTASPRWIYDFPPQPLHPVPQDDKDSRSAAFHIAHELNFMDDEQTKKNQLLSRRGRHQHRKGKTGTRGSRERECVRENIKHRGTFLRRQQPCYRGPLARWRQKGRI